MAGRGTDYSIKMSADIGDLEQKLSKARQSIENFGNNAQVAAKGMQDLFNVKGLDQLASQFSSVEAVVNKLGTTFSKTGGSTKQQLRVLQQSAADLTMAYRNLSDAEKQSAEGQALARYIDQLVLKGSEFKDTVDDVNLRIKALADDTRVLNALGQGVNVLASGFQVAAGAASVFGVSQEKIAAVQQKLTSIIAITNGLQQIQNLLQKESALMQTISIAKTQGWAVALGLKTAAQMADTAAIKANTVATETNTAAMKKNPLGLIVTLAVAAGVAIYELTDGFNALTEAEEAAANAAISVNNEMKNNSNTLASNITLINNMKNDMLAAGNNAEAQRKVFEKYRKKQVEVGLATKNAGEMALAVVENTDVIIKACELRMKAAAAEAAMQAEIAKVFAKVAEIREKAMKGEIVQSKELEAIGVNIQRLMAHGLKPEQTNLWSSLFGDGFRYSFPKEKVDEIMNDISAQALDHVNNTVTKIYQDIRLEAEKELANLKFEYPEIQWDTGGDDPTDKNTKNTNKNTKAKKDNTKATQEQKTQIEKLDEQYSKLTKSISGVNKETEKGAKKFGELKAQIKGTLMQKISIMPMNTVGDLEELIKTIQTLLEWLDNGSDEFKKFSDMLQNLRVMQAEQKLKLIDTSTLEGAQAAEQTISNLVSKLHLGTKEFDEWNKKLKDAKENLRKVQNEYNGIREDSLPDLEQQLRQMKSDRDSGLIPDSEIDDANDKIYELEKRIKAKKIQLGIEIAPTTDYEQRIGGYLKHINDIERSRQRYAESRSSLDRELSEEDAKLAKQLRDGLITQEQYNERSQKLWDDYADKIGNLPDVLVSVYKGLPLDNIPKFLQDMISQIDKELNENDLDVEARLNKEKTKANLQRDLENLTHGELTIQADITPDYIIKGSADDMRKSYENQLQKAQRLQGDYSIGLISYDAFKSTLAQMNEELENLHLKPIILEVKNPLHEQIDLAAEALGTLSSSLTQLGQATEDKSLNALGIFAEAIANIWLAYSKASAQAASMGPWAWVGFSLGALGQTIGIITAMKQNKFAGGGLVAGNRLWGDMQIARVNAGEMILNGSQQKRLFNLLDGGYTNFRGTNGSEVTFKVKGRDLIAVMNNQQDKMGKVR